MPYEMPRNTQSESLHDYNRQYQLVLRRVFPDKFEAVASAKTAQPYDLSPENRASLFRFYQYIEAEANLSPARRVRVFMLLSKVGEFLGKKAFDKLTREDVQELVTKVRHQPGWSATTQNYHLKALKRFMRFLNGDEECPPSISWLHLKERKNSKIRKEDLITEEEMARILEAAGNTMHKCILALLWEGLRVGELGTLHYRNITVEGKEVYISVKGKTGERTVMSITGLPYIRNWLDQHPTKRPDDWLFIIQSNYNKGNRLGYQSIRDILSKSCQKAGVNGRRIHPHLFRHSSITDRRRKGMRQREASAFYGVSGNVMSAVYDHLADTDVHNEIRRVLGGSAKPMETTSKMEPKKCSFCPNLNPHYATICFNCGNALSTEDELAKRDHFKVLEEENKLIRMELETMRGFMEEFRQMVREMPAGKKRELVEAAEIKVGEIRAKQ